MQPRHGLSWFITCGATCGNQHLPLQGLMMLPASSLPPQGAESVYKRLWVHEVFRVFYDRLVDDSDRVWLLQQVGCIILLTRLVNKCAICCAAARSTTLLISLCLSVADHHRKETIQLCKVDLDA